MKDGRSTRPPFVATHVLAALLLAGALEGSAGVNVFAGSGPEGGSILSLAFNPGGTIFAASGERIFAQTGGGIFLRHLGAPKWERSGLVGLGVRSVRVSPKDGNVMWAVASAGLSRSNDAGITWVQVANPPSAGPALAVVPDPQEADGAFVSTSQTIWKTSDGGRTWRARGEGLPVNASLGILEVDVKTGALYAGTGASVAPAPNLFRSSNGGDSWIAVTTPAPDNPIGAFVVDPERPSTLYLSLTRANLPAAAYRSTDSGVSWEPMALSSFQSLAVSPLVPQALFAANEGRLFRSTDGGRSFLPMSDLPFPGQGRILAISPDGTIYWAGERGVFRSIDGGTTWLPFVEGLAASEVCGVAIDASPSRRLYAGTASGLYASLDGGASWGTATGPALSGYGPLPVCTVFVDAKTPARLLSGTVAGTLYMSTDSGATWSSKGEFGFGGIVAIAPDPDDPSVLYLGSNHIDGENPASSLVLRSKDGGTTWSSTGGILKSRMLSFFVAPWNPTTFLAGSYGQISISTDGGASWVVRQTGFEVDALAADPAHPGWIYAGGTGGSGLAFSPDWGSTWAPRNVGLPPVATFKVSSLAFDPTSATSLFVSLRLPDGATRPSNNPAVFRSGNGGLTWTPFSAGLVNAEATALAIDRAGVLIGSPGNGAWTLTYGGAPRLDSISPGSGSDAGGTLVLLTGDGLRADSVVTIGGSATRETTFFDSRTLRVRTTAHPAGVADVVVTNPDGLAAQLRGAFRYETWGPGAPDETVLSLEGGRFRVEVDWKDAVRPAAGKGRAQTLTITSGYFWFDWNQKPEVVVKILDGRTENGHYWISVGGLTDLEFTLHVTDTTTGVSKDYHNPAGRTTALLDRESF